MPTPPPSEDASAEDAEASPSPEDRNAPLSNTKPLSRGASRAFVIACIVLVLGASIGGAYLLIELADSNARLQEQATPPADSTGGPLPDPGQ